MTSACKNGGEEAVWLGEARYTHTNAPTTLTGKYQESDAATDIITPLSGVTNM